MVHITSMGKGTGGTAYISHKGLRPKDYFNPLLPSEMGTLGARYDMDWYEPHPGDWSTWQMDWSSLRYPLGFVRDRNEPYERIDVIANQGNAGLPWNNCANDTPATYLFGSPHKSGCPTAFCDGSVRLIAQKGPWTDFTWGSGHDASKQWMITMWFYNCADIVPSDIEN